ncbi:MAG: fumarylacetoacetate hydrolase family protein [Bdellovibrionales bacterium]|nr:fumarylacetoacetate hydrolase family protein [Bdellovibrionales bacterium]
MKVVTYLHRHTLGVEKRLGILVDDNTILDPNLAFACDYEREGRFNARERANMKCPSSLNQLLRLKENPLEILHEACGLMLFFEKCGTFEMKDGTKYLVKRSKNISLGAPLDKIETYRDFFAHEKHVATGFKKRNEPIPPAWFELPVYYKGATAGFIGHEEEILWPSYTDILDYELELGMVVGLDGFNIKAKDAHKHIFGFTILNDVSARDIQRKEMSVRLGPAKAKDFCSVIGPVIVTVDEFESCEPNLLMTAKINGALWSSGQSGDSHFSWAQMIEHASRDEWVLAGDFFGSGTVGTGCGLELDRWIQPGDTVELEIEKIGKLVNVVGKKSHGKL